MMTCVPGMDSIRIAFNEDGEIVEATWKGGGILYLRSTPLLEHAGEMRDAIRYLLPMAKGYAGIHPEGVNQEICQDADNLLADIEKAEGEVDDANM